MLLMCRITIESEWTEDHSINDLGPNRYLMGPPKTTSAHSVLRQNSEHVVTGGRVLRTPSLAAAFWSESALSSCGSRSIRISSSESDAIIALEFSTHNLS